MKWRKFLNPFYFPTSLGELMTDLNELQPTDEILIGYRGFNLTFEDNRITLRGSHGQAWKGPALEAVCTISNNSAEEAVQHLKDNTCHCGIYSYTAIEKVQVGIGQDPSHANDSWECSLRRRQGDIGVIKELGVLARVVNWGYMVEGSMGWRSQYSKIQELTLYLPRPNCEYCGESYIPTTRNQGSTEIFWACDYTHGKQAQPLLNRLHSELTGYYQCPVNVEYMNQRVTNESN